jgi:hypothetical protein
MTETGPNRPLVRDKKLYNNFLTDLRCAHQSLQIEPDTVKYASCPRCCSIYPPKQTGRVMEWPSECTWRTFPDSRLCGQCLVKSAVVDGESVRAPIQPFVIQDFDLFVGRLLCRPGYEKILDEGTVLCEGCKNMLDIKDGFAIRDSVAAAPTRNRLKLISRADV